MSAAAALLCMVPPPCCLGAQAGDGEQPGAVEGQAGSGGAGPILLAPSLSSFVRGTDHRKRAVWCCRWEFGSLWGRWKINFPVASSTGTERWGTLL